jgi:hypothetical protein
MGPTGEGRDERNIEEAKMLSKSRCPHTGVVNFFTQADPLLSVGSVAEAGAPARYVWRCYVGEEVCGLTEDMSLAEALLRRAIAGGDAQGVGNARRKAETAARQSQSAAYWRELNEAALYSSRRSWA